MNEGTQPLVSVYLPTHCRPLLAMRAVRSVLAQDYPNIQLIVCDDGTPFENTEELRQLLDSNAALYLRNEEPKGACFSRNRAIEKARGRFITGLDDDDEFTPHRITELVAAYEPKYAFVATSYLELSTKGCTERKFDHGYVTFDALLHYNKIGNQMLTETARVRDVGGFDARLPAMQDYDLWLRLTQCYGAALKLPVCSYVLHTEHESERISTQADKQIRALNILKQKYQSDFKSRHWRSIAILEKVIRELPFSWFETARALHHDNYRWLLLNYFKQFRF